MNRFKTFILVFLKELINPINYLMAIIVGLLINFLQTQNPFDSWVSFAVPVLVQSLSKSILKYSNRYKEILLLLPGEREQPAFVMDHDGVILVSSENTSTFFDQPNISTFSHLFPQEFNKKTSSREPGIRILPCPAARTNYRVQIKKNRDIFLVWCDIIRENIT